jgi:hypothetical protein
LLTQTLTVCWKKKTRRGQLEEAFESLILQDTREQENKTVVERVEARRDRLGEASSDYMKLLRMMIELDIEDARALLRAVGEDRAAVEEGMTVYQVVTNIV